MSRPESKLYKKLKKHLTGFFMQRIENSVDLGTPDLFFCSNEMPRGWPQGWIELKQMNLPVRETTRIKIPYQQGQFRWLRDACRAGILVILLVQTDKGVFCFDRKNIQETYTHKEFYSLGTCFPDVYSKAENIAGNMTIRAWINNL